MQHLLTAEEGADLFSYKAKGFSRKMKYGMNMGF
jgi:hypothetical protein